MAQLGHDVCLIERTRFPRSHLGESLSPGVLPLLDATGARDAVEEAGFQRVRRVHVRWDGEPHERQDPRAQGLLVDRGRFDSALLERAKALGVRVLQPASIHENAKDDHGWRIDVEAEGETIHLRADFLVDARGRSSGNNEGRIRTGCRTVALYAYWRGTTLPKQPRVEAGSNAWYWGVPLPDATYNTLVFVDAKHFRGARPGSLQERFVHLLHRSALLTGCCDTYQTAPVRAADATPYFDEDSVTRSSIKLGEAALALDPLSSSGVQKAIQSALAAAVVANTLLRKPASSDAALRFYKTTLLEASERHRRWAANHYRSVAMQNGGTFWKDRATSAESSPPSYPSIDLSTPSFAATRVKLSPHLQFTELPCIESDFITVKPAVRHPNLEGPVAYLGGTELVPMLRGLPAGMTPLQIAQSWSSGMSLQSSLPIVAWLLKNAILVPQSSTECGRER
ncbi:MAG: hypothetical protein NVS2B5_17150 [Beijerinckiaceae bacterium]